MHSIIVLGDTRFHYIQIEDEKWHEISDSHGSIPPKVKDPNLRVILPGGAYMVCNAIRQMATESNLWPQNCNGKLQPDEQKLDNIIYSYVATGLVGETYGHIHSWKLIPLQLAGSDQTKARLAPSGQAVESKNRLPPISPRLIHVLKPNADPSGCLPPEASFDEIECGDGHLSSCPDVFVIDDLGQDFRKLSFIRDFDGAQVAVDAYRDNLSHDLDPRSLHCSVLGLLFERFHRARQKSLDDTRSMMEPVVIGSIRNHPSEIFESRWMGGTSVKNHPQQEQSVWLHIVDDPWLRRRTIILLDVEDLRKDGLSISRGLSWERTAQDAISQIRHSPLYRQFLQFGHVIVRFGVTGALHIDNSDYRSGRSYTLIFDPEHDDRHLSLTTRDGTVLGDTSIYVAHLVRAIQQECRRKVGRPELVRLEACIQSAVSESIKCSLRLSQVSYGSGSWQSFYTAMQASDGSHTPFSLPRGIFSPRYSQQSWADEPGLWRVDVPSKADQPIKVVSASIPPSLQRQWSILMQSALVGDMQRIAESIVNFGATSVFNLRTKSSLSRARDILVEQLAVAAMDVLPLIKNDDGTFSDEHIGELWPSIVKEGTRRYLMEAYSDHPVERLSDSKLFEFEPAGNPLVPPRQVLEGGKLWSHLNSAESMFKLDAIIANLESHFPGAVSRCLHEDFIITPLAKYGKKRNPLFIVDRREVEGYRAIERLMRQHFERVIRRKSKRPLCIALFGPPGSGKSFAVKAINDAIGDSITNKDKLDIQVLPAFNLAQYTSAADLEAAFTDIESRINNKKSKELGKSVVPIAFFDEFDSNYDKQELGWLKFFLAPMEDGAFLNHNVQDAILVFAGGTRQTFDEFNMAHRPPTDDQWIAFSKAKGPDFASRLSGHLDIVGINTTGAEDELFIIRRALLIRSVLSDLQSLKEGVKARIDDKLIRALLRVPNFRNGGRSVRMLLELCLGESGEVAASEIPPIHQLNMHVDGKAFLDLLHERGVNS